LIKWLWLGLLLAACRPASNATTTAVPNDGTLVVAWVEAGNLVLWRDGDTIPRRIASGGVIRVYLAPDGEHVVFTRGPQGTEETLWVVDAAGAAEQQLVGPKDVRPVRTGKPLIGQVEWYDANVLYFNTLLQTDNGVQAQNDLYRANVRTREVALILPRSEGGQFAISPDRQHIAVAYPGTYGRQDGRIKVIDPLGAQPARNLLFFIGVSTGSEYGFYPPSFWEPDNSAVRVVIPDKDSLYADHAQPVELWRLPIDNPSGRQQLGIVTASFFGLPKWSSDMSKLTFLQRVGDPTSNQFELFVADGDGKNPISYATGHVGAFEPARWIPGTTYFVYASGDPGSYWLGAPGQPPNRLPNAGEPMFTPLFTDKSVYVFATPPGSSVQLRYAHIEALGAASSPIAFLSAPLSVYDAVVLPPKSGGSS
jgi:hypothetical protein